jgi:hypothetical protein
VHRCRQQLDAAVYAAARLPGRKRLLMSSVCHHGRNRPQQRSGAYCCLRARNCIIHSALKGDTSPLQRLLCRLNSRACWYRRDGVRPGGHLARN